MCVERGGESKRGEGEKESRRGKKVRRKEQISERGRARRGTNLLNEEETRRRWCKRAWFAAAATVLASSISS